jgi:hypothetical protein
MFRVPPGKQYLYVQDHPPEGYVRPDPTEPEVADGQTVAVTFELARSPWPQVAGRVLLPDGKPATGASVRANAEMPEEQHAAAGDDGRFRFPALRPGSRLRARKGDLVTGEDTVTTGRQDDLTLQLRENPKTSLLVTAVDAEGKPVKGARVQLSVKTGEYFMGSAGPHPVTGADGRCVLKDLSPHDVYQVSIHADGYGIKYAPVNKLTPGKQNDAPPISLRRADKLITGRIVDKAGKAMPGMRVHINGSSTGYRTIAADEDGQFEFRVVPGDKPDMWLQSDAGKSIARRTLAAAEDDVTLVYDPADVKQP